MENNELCHHGVKGQKWGVRRFQNKNGSLTNAGKKRRGIEKSENKLIKQERLKDSRNRRKLTEVDLKKKIERLKLEKEFKNLTKEEITPGKKFVSDVMSSSGKKALATIASGAMLYMTKVALTKEFDLKDAANYLTPKPKNK